MRARNIKPGFFKNELLGTADPLLSLLFEGLWLLADREGRLEDRPLRIKAEIFPYRENLDINGSLTELERMGFICRYTVEDSGLIQIVNFRKHQTPHKTERVSCLPSRPDKVLENKATGSVTVIEQVNSGEQTAALPPDSSFPDLLIPDSPIPETAPSGAVAPLPDPVSLVVQAFDSARAEVFGEEARRLFPAADDRVFAGRFLATGTTLEWLKSFFLERMAKRKKGDLDAPEGLKYFEKAVPEAVTRLVATKNSPQAQILQPKLEAVERTPEEQAKYDTEQRAWYLKMGRQHQTYNPEGLTEREACA